MAESISPPCVEDMSKTDLRRSVQKSLAQHVKTYEAAADLSFRKFVTFLAEDFGVPEEKITDDKHLKKKLRKLAQEETELFIAKLDEQEKQSKKRKKKEAHSASSPSSEEKSTQKQVRKARKTSRKSPPPSTRTEPSAVSSRKRSAITSCSQANGKRRKRMKGEEKPLSQVDKLRRLVTRLSIGPQIYRNLPQDDETKYLAELHTRLVEKCQNIGVIGPEERQLPTLAEAAQFAKKRAFEKEFEDLDLDLIDTTTTRRRRTPSQVLPATLSSSTSGNHTNSVSPEQTSSSYRKSKSSSSRNDPESSSSLSSSS